ncbi:glutamate synthase subunit beta [Rosistilla ulvae]|uniref:Glutamate synthase subunit beta n=1 Tax=Rosistilla ulvae TaxID=1930277 RepID=A0A517M340_9BACT|nr:FAD-dependent oxidoreductase [Rosistilla ulvae]QDS89291.1 glutamate synthase subunit beta [Rosistilla ulvae]
MIRYVLPRIVLLLVLALRCVGAIATETAIETDVCVFGSTPAGIAAAVAAAKAGHGVALIEPTDRIGGMLTSGLSHTDFRSFEALTGFFLDFSQRVEADYVKRYGADSEQVQAAFRGTHGEPSVNLRILQAMIAEQPSIQLIPRQSLHRVATTPFVGGRRRIASATFVDPSGQPLRVDALTYIDATYEGDLMAAAGERYHVGRESRQQYGESQAGDSEGRADGQVQGYNLRLIMTTDPANMREPVQPAGYDRADFLAVLPVLAIGKQQRVFASDHSGIFRAHFPGMPNSKADINDTPHALVRLSMPDINDAYPDGDPATRAEIVAAHYAYNLGLLYFLQHDTAVPEAIRDDARRWGFCRDEFPDTDGIPPQLYIREARRMIGQHVFTGRDTRQVEGDARAVWHRDSIAIGDYVHNCHGTGRTGSRFDGQHEGEFYKKVPPYQIPYGVIVPAITENLLVPVACSASHFGFGALRLEPIWSSLGQAAGWAAAIQIEQDLPLQAIDVQRLQQRLHADGSATIYVADVPPESADFAAVQWWGTRGGLHGLAPAEQPRPKSLGSQYNASFPGHFAELDRPVTEEVLAHWNQLLPEEPSPTPASASASETSSRRDWIRDAWLRHAR